MHISGILHRFKIRVNLPSYVNKKNPIIEIESVEAEALYYSSK